MNRSLLPVLLALPLACRGTFDISQYLADGESGDASSSTNTMEATATTDAGTTLDESGTATETTDTDTTTDTNTTTDTDTTTDTAGDCPQGQFDIGKTCIALLQSLEAGANSPTDMAIAHINDDAVLDLLLPGNPAFWLPGSPGGFSAAISINGANGSG